MNLFKEQAVILVDLIESNDYVSGVALAEYTCQSSKAIKKNIDLLNKLCNENGCNIISKIGVGYQLEVTDESLYVPFKEYILNKSYGHFFYRNYQSERVHYIIRQLLKKESLTLRQLCEQCNYSESTIQRDLLKVRPRLERYHLTLLPQMKNKIQVVGDEWSFRLATVNEEFIKDNFSAVVFDQAEDTPSELYQDVGKFKQTLFDSLSKVAKENHYQISYVGLRDICEMFAVFFKRQEFVNKLEDNPYFHALDLTIEKQMVERVFNNLNLPKKNVSLSEREIDYLACYILCHREFKYAELQQQYYFNYIHGLIEGFIDHLNDIYEIKVYDTVPIKENLCCVVANIYLNSIFNISLNPILNKQYLKDGVTNLDFCNVLCQYLQENLLELIEPYNVLYCYTCFQYFDNERTQNPQVKILVVAKNGYFESTSFAYSFAKLASYKDVEYVPASYEEIETLYGDDVAGVITDINHFNDMMSSYNVENMHLYIENMHLFRRSEEIDRATNHILDAYYDQDSLFTSNSIHYVEEFNDVAEIEQYIRDNILKDDENADEFIRELKKKDTIYSPHRGNCLLLNTIGDCLGREFIDIITIKTPMAYDDDYINKIVIYNCESKSLDREYYFSRKITRILHSRDLYFTGDREDDYRRLHTILYLD